MKILLINGSPKGEKSDTLHIAKAFIEGMNMVSDNTIEYIDVMKKKINYCCGDLSCMRNGGHCVYNDDMEEILEKILESDLLLFSFPLYGFGVPAPLKALLDRTLPLGSIAMRKAKDRYEHVEQADFSHLKYCIISGCGFPNSKNNFEALRMQFHLRFYGKEFMLTVPESPLFNIEMAEPVTKPYLELVKQAGVEYNKFGKVSDELLNKLAVPMIDEEVYAKMANGEI